MSIGSCLFGSAVLACLLSATAVWAQQPIASNSVKTSAPVPEIPYPSGPSGIGRVGFDWIDTTRPDNYDPKRERELMVYFWYPTAKSVGAKGQYFPGAAQMDAAPAIHELMSQEFGKRWAPIVSGEISSHAVNGAPIASSRSPFPVVTFSHGAGGTGFEYTVLIEDLVSHGYVVASIEHTYTAKAVWFPDGMLPAAVAAELAEAIRGRKTILIAGGTDTGKTTFANALIDFIPQHERLGVIEDTAELKIDRPNVFRFEARKEQVDGSGKVTVPAVTVRDLVKATLRHRPDRLIIGEVRGGEAFDLLDALNTGHAGSISTLHANSALQALSRLATLTLRADVDLPYKAVQGEIGDLIDLVIHIQRKEGRRSISQVVQLHGFDADAGRYETTELYH